jgi:hypothetical protein
VLGHEALKQICLPGGDHDLSAHAMQGLCRGQTDAAGGANEPRSLAGPIGQWGVEGHGIGLSV